MNEKLEKSFQIAAVILIGIAAFFLWQGNTDALFISAVLGSVSFFLSVRFQVKERMEQREKEKATEEITKRRASLVDSAAFDDDDSSSDDSFASNEAIENERRGMDKTQNIDHL